MAEMPPTRASLLVRLRDRRDQTAWQEFVALYGPLVYGYARKQGLQDADQVAVNGRPLFDDLVPSHRNWSTELSLEGVDLGESARIELISSTCVAAEVNPGIRDTRKLGVKVKQLVLVGASAQ
jgi:hypothetical protein